MEKKINSLENRRESYKTSSNLLSSFFKIIFIQDKKTFSQKIYSKISLFLEFFNLFENWENSLHLKTKSKFISEIIFSVIHSYTGILGLPIVATSINIPIKTRKVIEK